MAQYSAVCSCNDPECPGCVTTEMEEEIEQEFQIQEEIKALEKEYEIVAAQLHRLDLWEVGMIDELTRILNQIDSELKVLQQRKAA